MDTTIAAHQWGMTLMGWLGAAGLGGAGIVLGLVLGCWWARAPRH